MNYQNTPQRMPMMGNMQQQMGYPQQQQMQMMGYPQQQQMQMMGNMPMMGYPQQQMQMGYPQQQQYYPQHNSKSWYQTFWGKRIAAVIVIAILAVLLYYYGCDLPIIGWFCSIFSTIRKFFGGILSVF